jgi:transitional endoplasmic reticulum ATPase
MHALDLEKEVVIIKSADGKMTVASALAGENNDNTVTMPIMMRRTIGDKKIGDFVSIEPYGGTWNIYTGKAMLEIVASDGITKLTAEILKSIGERFITMYGGRVPMMNGDMFTVVFPNNPGVLDVKILLPEGVWKLPKQRRQSGVQSDQDDKIDVIDKREINAATAVGWADIGGMEQTIEDLRFYVELPLEHPEIFFKRMHKAPPRGILLYGPPGCGKTMLAKAIATECKANFVAITPSGIYNKYQGESEANVRKEIESAYEKGKTIIFIDEIDAMTPKRDNGTASMTDMRIVSELLSAMDGFKNEEGIVFIGATNRPEAIDPAFRRPGRFEKEIEILPPNEEGRKQILQIHLRDVPILETDDETGSVVNIAEIAKLTHGYVGADIAGLVRESVYKNIRRNKSFLDLKLPVIPDDQLEHLILAQEDLLEAMDEITPSALRSVSVEIPDVSWDKVGGLDDVKEKLIETVIWNTEKKDLVKTMGIRLPKGVLLFGPPGSGKTLLAKAIATESKCNFISIKGPEFISKWMGESERAIRGIFKIARQSSPCIVFIDEFDAVAPIRVNEASGGGGAVHEMAAIVSQMLTELDGVEERKEVILIASTNRPDMIDPALLRKGRIDRIIFVPAPDEASRKSIFEVHLQGKKIEPEVDIKKLSIDLAAKSINFSGSDIEAVIMEAGILAIKENHDYISVENMMAAVESMSPSLDENVIAYYEKLKADFNKKVVKRRVNLNYMT